MIVGVMWRHVFSSWFIAGESSQWRRLWTPYAFKDIVKRVHNSWPEKNEGTYGCKTRYSGIVARFATIGQPITRCRHRFWNKYASFWTCVQRRSTRPVPGVLCLLRPHHPAPLRGEKQESERKQTKTVGGCFLSLSLFLSFSLSLSTPRDFHTPGLLSLQLLFRTNYLLWWIPLFVILEWCIVRFLNFAVISLCCVSYISTSVEYFLYSCFLWRFPCNVRSLVIF